MLSSYRRVLAEPGTLRFSAAGLVARLPISMVGLGIVLLVSSATGYSETRGDIISVSAVEFIDGLDGEAIDEPGIFASVGQHVGTMRVAGEREDVEIGDVGEDVEQTHRPGADRERARQVPGGVLHLGGRKGDVVPGVAREQRAHHGRPQHRDDGDRPVPGAPEVGEVGGGDVRLAEHPMCSMYCFEEY